MQNIDPEKAARVWQRVRAGTDTALQERIPADTQPGSLQQRLPEMIAGEWADAAAYLQLSRKYSGREAAILRQMFEQEQSHAACLKGIYTLLTGQHTVSRTAMPPAEPASVVLRRCYGREMQCLAQYEQWAEHPQFGQVFARLARQEQEHCGHILELIGKLRTQP